MRERVSEAAFQKEVFKGGPENRGDIDGFIYDPNTGDPERGFPAGTPFEELPEGWTCPICYASKESFDRL